jgi:hypothetical protein
LEPAQKTLSKRDYSFLALISLTLVHTIALLKSHTPDLNIEQLQRDFPFDNDEERDALIDSIYDTTQHFMSQYDFSVINDSDDNGSPGA